MLQRYLVQCVVRIAFNTSICWNDLSMNLRHAPYAIDMPMHRVVPSASCSSLRIPSTTDHQIAYRYTTSGSVSNSALVAVNTQPLSLPTRISPSLSSQGLKRLEVSECSQNQKRLDTDALQGSSSSGSRFGFMYTNTPIASSTPAHPSWPGHHASSTAPFTSAVNTPLADASQSGRERALYGPGQAAEDWTASTRECGYVYGYGQGIIGDASTIRLYPTEYPYASASVPVPKPIPTSATTKRRPGARAADD
jgi:hypothetical protein